MLKQYTNSSWLKEVKRKLELSEKQRSVLIGTILGDGYLRESRSGRAARLQICHSVSARDYVLWKWKIFSNWVYAIPRITQINRSIRFTTVSHVSLLEFYNSFYVENTKIVPNNICDVLKDDLSLAVWFMDDGNGYLHSGAFRISTYAFGLEGNYLLRDCLQTNFGIGATVVRDNKGHQLYIPVRGGSARRFRTIIEPYVIPTMRYKLLSISPVETNIEGTRYSGI